MLWLSSLFDGIPPTVLYTLSWTHGLTPMSDAQISPMSVLRKRFNTAFPKEPVPPVIISILPENDDISLYHSNLFITYLNYFQF